MPAVVDCFLAKTENAFMTAEAIDISSLSPGQRVALMERLWRSLAGDLESQGPPAWHEAELDSRQKEWAERGSVAQEWSVVREELRRGLK
jgi:hypothetical protein